MSEDEYMDFMVNVAIRLRTEHDKDIDATLKDLEFRYLLARLEGPTENLNIKAGTFK